MAVAGKMFDRPAALRAVFRSVDLDSSGTIEVGPYTKCSNAFFETCVAPLALGDRDPDILLLLLLLLLALY
jgi:hypothetical protein